MRSLLWLPVGPLVVWVGNWIAEVGWRRPARRHAWQAFIDSEHAKGPIFREYTAEELTTGRFRT